VALSLYPRARNSSVHDLVDDTRPTSPPAVCMNRGRPSRRGRSLINNKLDGSIPQSLSALAHLTQL
jgi:hypothetical protein